jgi:hypothetical protein
MQDLTPALTFTPAGTEGVGGGISLSSSKGILCGGRSYGDAYSAGVVSVSVMKSSQGSSTATGVGIGPRAGYESIISAQTYVARDRAAGACG